MDKKNLLKVHNRSIDYNVTKSKMFTDRLLHSRLQIKFKTPVHFPVTLKNIHD